MEGVETPNRRTVAEVSKFLNLAEKQLIKTLIYKADDKFVAVIIPGNRAVNTIKLSKAIGCGALELVDNATLKEVTGAPVGFAGPVGLALPIYADRTLQGYRGWRCRRE